MESRLFLSGSPLLNEIEANPPGTDDNRYEYIELSGTPGQSLNNIYFVAFDGTAGSTGVADVVVNLSSYSIGSDGLLVIQSSATAGHSIPAATTLVSDPTFFTQSGGFANGSLSFFLYSSPNAPFIAGTDYDTNDDGTLDHLPAGATALDDVAIPDTNNTGSDIVYGNVAVTEQASQNTGTADAVTRFPNNTSTTNAAWYGGELVDTGNVDSTIDYDATRQSANEPANALLTPGEANSPQPVYSYVTDQSTYTLGIGQTATVKVYLQETLNGNTSIISGHGENGLAGAGFEVVSGTRPTNPSSITAINADITDFAGPLSTKVNNSNVANPNEADLLENVAPTATTGVGLGNSGAPSNEVYLGSLTITGGSTAGTTTFKLGEYDVSGNSGGNTITNPDGFDLDTSDTTPVAYTGVGNTLTTFSVITTSGTLPTPTVTVTSGDIVYNGSAYAPTTSVTGSSGTDVGAAETYTYYAGSAATGIPLSAAPITPSTYTVVANFAGDSTYSAASSAPKTFNIAAKTLTPTIVATNKTYDGTATASVTYSLAGIVGSDVVTASGTATFANASVGTGKTVTAIGITLGGAAAIDYSLVSTTASTTANIIAKSLTPTIIATNKTYDRTTTAGVTYSLTGIVGSDAVTANGTATFSDKNAGSGKTVTATGITLSGAASGNYSLASTTASTTANITALAITGSITANNKTFDGTTAATIATRSLTGVISGDTVSYVGGTATFASTGPGTGILVTATGLSLSGADAGNYTVNTTATATADIAAFPPIVYSYVTDQSTYNLGFGQTATVKIYLQETLNGNTSLIDGHGENGLLGAGFEVVSGTLPNNPSNITAINDDSADFGGAPATHLNNSAVSNPNEADLLENIAITASTGVGLGNRNGAAANEVYLGSLTVTGGSTAGTTNFNLGEYDVSGNSGGNTITNPDGIDVDTSGSAGGTLYTGVGTTLTTFSVVTSAASLPTPTMTVTSGNMEYNASAYVPTTIVTGTSGTDAGATETYTYYAGGTATGTPLSGAPGTVGTYTVIANFAGDSSYAAASSSPTTFNITAATPVVTVTAPASGPFSGNPFTATATVTGVGGATLNLTPTFVYTNTGTNTTSSTAPTAAGSYSVVASVTASTNYTAASSSAATFTITASATAPTLVSAQVGNGAVQRSTVSGITVVFNEAVNFTTASFILSTTQKESNGYTAISASASTVSNPSGDGKTWVISCKAGGSLDRTGAAAKGFFVDAIYQLTLNGAAITDAATGTAHYNSGNTQIVNFLNGSGVSKNAFSVLYGDMLGNGAVNVTDYGKFKTAFGSSANGNSHSKALYNAAIALDWNGDGLINLTDYGKFKLNFGKSFILS